MLAMLAELRRQAALPARRLQSLARAVASDAAAPDDAGPPTLTRRNNQLRFFVISNQPAAGLDLLERSILGQPIAGAPGAPPRFLKLPPAAVCNKVLHSAAQSRDAALVSKAADLADALALHSVGVEGRTLRALAGALGRQGAVGRALPLLDRWLAGQAEALEDDEAAAQEPLHLLTALVEAAARAEDAPSVLATLARFAAVGLNPSTPSMTSLLQCFMRLGHVDTAHAMVAWMRRNGLRPSAFTYTALLALPRDGGSPAAAKAVLAKAQEALAEMRAEGVQPTPHLFAALVHVCGRAHDLGAARAAWADMRAAGVEPDLVLWSAMLDACAKSRDPAAALQLYAEMQQRGMQPDVVAFSSLLAALKGAADAAQQAGRVWAAMAAAGVRPNGFAYAAYLDALLAGQDFGAAIRLLEDAVQLAKDQEEPADGEHEGRIEASGLWAQALAAAAGRGADGSLPRQLVRLMAAHGVPHSPRTLAALLTGQATQRSCSAAKWLLQAEDDGGGGGGGGADWELHPGTVDSCLLGAGSADEAMAAAMERHAAGGVPPGAGEVLAILGGLGVQAKPERALEWYGWARARGASLGWPALRLLMFGALNACPPQPALVLRALAESRAVARAGEWWDPRTERAVFIALRKMPRPPRAC